MMKIKTFCAFVGGLFLSGSAMAAPTVATMFDCSDLAPGVGVVMSQGETFEVGYWDRSQGPWYLTGDQTTHVSWRENPEEEFYASTSVSLYRDTTFTTTTLSVNLPGNVSITRWSPTSIDLTQATCTSQNAVLLPFEVDDPAKPVLEEVGPDDVPGFSTDNLFVYIAWDGSFASVSSMLIENPSDHDLIIYESGAAVSTPAIRIEPINIAPGHVIPAGGNHRVYFDVEVLDMDLLQANPISELAMYFWINDPRLRLPGQFLIREEEGYLRFRNANLRYGSTLQALEDVYQENLPEPNPAWLSQGVGIAIR